MEFVLYVLSGCYLRGRSQKKLLKMFAFVLMPNPACRQAGTFTSSGNAS